MQQWTYLLKAKGEEIHRIIAYKTRALATVYTRFEWRCRTLRGCDQAKDSIDASKLKTTSSTLERDLENSSISAQSHSKIPVSMENLVRVVPHLHHPKKWRSYQAQKARPISSSCLWMQSLCNDDRRTQEGESSTEIQPKGVDWLPYWIRLNECIPNMESSYQQSRTNKRCYVQRIRNL